jgi:hypothetical protein
MSRMPHGVASPESANELPSTRVDDQESERTLLPGTRAYADAARRYRAGELTTAEFLRLLYGALAARLG